MFSGKQQKPSAKITKPKITNSFSKHTALNNKLPFFKKKQQPSLTKVERRLLGRHIVVNVGNAQRVHRRRPQADQQKTHKKDCQNAVRHQVLSDDYLGLQAAAAAASWIKNQWRKRRRRGRIWQTSAAAAAAAQSTASQRRGDQGWH